MSKMVKNKNGGKDPYQTNEMLNIIFSVLPFQLLGMGGVGKIWFFFFFHTRHEAQIQEIVLSQPSVPNIEIVKKCFGPQTHSLVFGFGGGVKAKDMKGKVQFSLNSPQRPNRDLTMEIDHSGFKASSNDIEILFGILFKEMYEMFDHSSLHDTYANDLSQGNLQRNMSEDAETFFLLVRCCMVALTLHKYQLDHILEKGNVLLVLLRRLGSITTYPTSVSHACTSEDDDCRMIFRDEFVVSLHFIELSDIRTSFLCATFEEIVWSQPSMPSIENVEKCFGPQTRSHVFGFGGGVKAKNMKGGTTSKSALLSELRSSREENQALKDRLSTVEKDMAEFKKFLSAQQSTVQPSTLHVSEEE